MDPNHIGEQWHHEKQFYEEQIHALVMEQL